MNDAIRATGIDARRLEEASFNCVPVQRQLFYDGWLLRATPGQSKRARSVSAFFGSTRPLAEKIAHCEALYDRLGLPCLFRSTPFDVPAALDRELAARGYVEFDNTLVQTADLAQPRSFEMPRDVVIAPVSPSTFSTAFGMLSGAPARQRAIRRAWLANTPLPVRSVVASIDGRAVGVGQCAIDDGLAMIGSVATADDMRGRGIATAIVGALQSWASERRARFAYLQVTDDNYRALSVYRRFGFGTVYAYHYRRRIDASG